VEQDDKGVSDFCGATVSSARSYPTFFCAGRWSFFLPLRMTSWSTNTATSNRTTTGSQNGGLKNLSWYWILLPQKSPPHPLAMGELLIEKALGQLTSDKQKERTDGLAGMWCGCWNAWSLHKRAYTDRNTYEKRPQIYITAKQGKLETVSPSLRLALMPISPTWHAELSLAPTSMTKPVTRSLSLYFDLLPQRDPLSIEPNNQIQVPEAPPSPAYPHVPLSFERLWMSSCAT
jgi:hypothetical protein